MISLSSILVDLDALAEQHPALDRAIALAARCGAGVKVIDVLPPVPAIARHFVTADLEQELVEHRRARLDVIAGEVQQVPVTTELLRGRPADAVTEEVLRARHDLVVRSHERELTASSRRFGAVDMELLRHCPCPVWLINRSHGRPSGVLAAVHVDPFDPVQQQLNATIVEWALLLRELDGGGELTLLQAWTVFGASVLKSRMSHEEFAAVVEAVRRQADESLRAFTGSMAERLAGVSVQTVEGDAADAITRVAEEKRVGVVVMGTVARTGLAGLLMGNTAERVLQRLERSVLAVKPPGFPAAVTAAAGKDAAR